MRRRFPCGDQHDADVRALVNLSALSPGYLPWSGSALRPATAVRVLSEILVNDRKRVVELGSGISTILISALNREFSLGLELTTIDENEGWLRQTELRARQVDPKLKLTAVHSALVPYRGAAMDVSRWYDVDRLKDVQGGIDLLIIDGPTAYEKSAQYDRWPALPVFYGRMSASCTVVLDDTSRRGEARIAKDWARRFGDFATNAYADETFLTRGERWNV